MTVSASAGRLGRLLFRPAKKIGKLTSILDVAARCDQLERKIDRLESFSHGARATYVGNNRVLVKAVVADCNLAYLVEADDKLLSPWFIITGTYETELTDFLVREIRQDSHCIDVGANFGYFACLMSRFAPAGRVIAIEADQHVFALVRDNIAINGFENRAKAIHAAASDSDDEVTFHRRKTRSGNTSVIHHDPAYIEAMGELATERFTVRGICLDAVATDMQGRVDFIKIDVEGLEPCVLRGARRMIADNRWITIVMEWSPGQIQSAGFDVATFLSEIGELGLKPFDIVRDALVPLTSDDLLNIPYRAGIVLKTTSHSRPGK